jgi:uncharacterized membrane protein YfcA
MDVETQIGRVGVLAYVAIGVVAGLFAAMFGIGGGVVIVPLLILITKMPARMAAATSLATLILTSLMGVIRFAGSDHIDWVAAIVIGTPAIVGVLIGIRFQKRLPAEWLILGFGLFVVVIGLKMVFAL